MDSGIDKASLLVVLLSERWQALEGKSKNLLPSTPERYVHGISWRFLGLMTRTAKSN